MSDVVKQEQAIALTMVQQSVSWLAAVRIYKHLSRADAAKMLNITPELLARMEKKGQISTPLRSRMAEVYGCPASLLVCPSWMQGRTA
ncbi:helix-turn-helix transcriptional regulator [Salmonella enterica]|nr:helix-turn-helix transcriptional regulator [Salmonella enterica]